MWRAALGSCLCLGDFPQLGRIDALCGGRVSHTRAASYARTKANTTRVNLHDPHRNAVCYSRCDESFIAPVHLHFFFIEKHRVKQQTSFILGRWVDT